LVAEKWVIAVTTSQCGSEGFGTCLWELEEFGRSGLHEALECYIQSFMGDSGGSPEGQNAGRMWTVETVFTTL
jgi:hypothetical protein